MRKNRTKMVAFALLIGLLAAIPASTQVLSGDKGDPTDQANLGMVILINRLELTRDQMETIHDALAGILTEIDALDSRREEFYDRMLQFNGSADDLDQAIAAFHDQMSSAQEGLRDDMEAALDEIAGTLTMKQGEILRGALPGLFEPEGAGPRFGRGGMIGPDRSSVERDPWFGHGASEQGGVRGTIAERLASRFQSGSERDQALAVREGSHEGLGPKPMMKRFAEKKVDLLRQLVETLELKLSYVE